MPALHFELVVTGCPMKIPWKRKKKNLAETVQLNAEQPTRYIIMKDIKSITYWEDYNKETKGQAIGQFCHELQENIIDTFYSYFSTTGIDQKIQCMEANMQNWYFGTTKCHLDSQEPSFFLRMILLALSMSTIPVFINSTAKSSGTKFGKVGCPITSTSPNLWCGPSLRIFNLMKN